MEIIPLLKEVADLTKKGMTIELQEKIMELRGAVMDLQEDNLMLRKKIQELEAQLSQRDDLQIENGMYWLHKNGMKEAVPFCQKCHDGDGKRVRLQQRKPGERGYLWRCSVCHSGYGDYIPDPPQMSAFRRSRRDMLDGL